MDWEQNFKKGLEKSLGGRNVSGCHTFYLWIFLYTVLVND